MAGKLARAKYCSDICKERASNVRKMAKKRATGRTCVRCGDGFPYSRKSKRCEPCAVKLSKDRAEERAGSVAATEKPCNACGIVKAPEEFSTDSNARDGLQRACKQCQREAAGQNYRANRPAIVAKRAEYRKTPHSREIVWARTVERRARQAGAPVVERVWRLNVFERDGWVCQLCAKPMRRETGQHPESSTVDHIVPLVEEGEHTMANVHSAHRKCNRGKWDDDHADYMAEEWGRRGPLIPLGEVVALTIVSPDRALFPELDDTEEGEAA
jgi:5-methylcytosine-specific restriction endonuclease McrA